MSYNENIIDYIENNEENDIVTDYLYIVEESNKQLLEKSLFS